MPTFWWWSSRTACPVRFVGSPWRMRHGDRVRHHLVSGGWTSRSPSRPQLSAYPIDRIRHTSVISRRRLPAERRSRPSVQCVRDDHRGPPPDQLSLDQKVELLAGADTWHTAAFDDPPVPAIRMSDGPAGVRGTSWTGAAVGVVPVRRGARGDVGPGARRADRPGARPRGPLQERPRPAGADREPPPHADRRSQLRVPQRGPGADGGGRRRLRAGRAARARRRLHQALRRQRHRVRADDDLVGDRRAHPARAVPRAVRGGRAAGPTCGRS